ncbi:MAG: hypothetical protein GX222_01055 [Ruminococcaceae bacterium]|nr:hypothetical protein [Oscillospiraceae bacterium]
MILYGVELSDVNLNENGEIVGTSCCGDDCFYTADIYAAFENFKSRIDKVYYGYLLDICEITLDLDPGDISMYIDGFDKNFEYFKEIGPRVVIAQYFNHETWEGCRFDVLDHMVRQSSKYYNMRIICEKAGVNYSTFRGFKNNKQYFSEEKLIRLLQTMNKVGVGSWNEELYESIRYVEERMRHIG